MSPSILIWEVWKERNRHLFQDKETSIPRLQCKIEASIIELFNAQLMAKQKKKFTKWDAWIMKQWFGIKIPPLGYSRRIASTKQHNKTKWIPPEQGWAKLNFDGASKGNPGPSRVGCIIRTYIGSTLGRLSQPLIEGMNNAAEFQALLLRLKLGKELGIKNLIVEGDSTLVINALRTRQIHN